jgi:hypothetical protein
MERRFEPRTDAFLERGIFRELTGDEEEEKVGLGERIKTERRQEPRTEVFHGGMKKDCTFEYSWSFIISIKLDSIFHFEGLFISITTYDSGAIASIYLV